MQPRPTNPGSFDELVRDAHERLGPGLKSFLLGRCRSMVAAEELAQQTWSAVWESVKSGRYDPARAALSTFVYAVAANMLRRHRRADAASRHTLQDTDELADRLLGQGDPGKVVELAELVDSVRRFLSDPAVPHAEREVLRALAEGISDRDLAARLGVAPSTAHARKSAALARLRAAVVKRAERTGPEGEEPNEAP